MANMLPPHALSAGRPARLGAPRGFTTGCAALAGVVLLAAAAPPARGAGQPPAGQGSGQPASDTGWTPPRAPDGRPDVQGVWVNFDRTPLERPIETDAGRLAALERWFPGLEVTPQGIRGIRGPNPGGLAKLLGEGDGEGHSSKRSALRRSMVVDPPSGRVPIRPDAERRKDRNLRRLTDSYAYHTPWERCITRGVPGGMFPAGYNNAYRILQTPDHVAILYEMIHEPRIVPLDGRPHVDGAVRLWNGDSRGRWEGDALVVEVANYRSEQVGTIATGISTTATLKAVPQSAGMRVVERFTLIGPGRMRYDVTIEDPEVYDGPWTVSMPLHRDDEYDLYEYACHEGNYGLPNSLSGARAAERNVAARQPADR